MIYSPLNIVKGPNDNDRYAIWSSVLSGFLYINLTAEEAIASVMMLDQGDYPGGANRLEIDLLRAMENIEAKGRAWPWVPTFSEAVGLIVAKYGIGSDQVEALKQTGWLKD